MEFFMKKSILASSIAAAVIGMGAVGSAQAAITVSGTGIGDSLLIPYFSAQAENATLLSITNTDTVNGKAVKVRFRGAANSDDVYDFQVFLSPTDVFTANISKGANGRAKFTSSDASCTKPALATLNATPFVTDRLNQALTGDALANGTREGYIEIIGMADIPPNQAAGTARNFTNVPGTAATATTSATTVVPLFTAIKHTTVDGKRVAPCSGSAFTALDTATNFGLTNTAGGTASALGLLPSTGGLMANYTIINTLNAAAWSGQATALISDATTVAGGTKNVTYFPQTDDVLSLANVTTYSADPIFLTAGSTNSYNATTQATTAVVGVAPVAVAGNYDMPDLSTVIDQAYANPSAQVTGITTALTTNNIVAEFLTDSSINASTDWVFTMPGRRYNVAMAYSKVSSTNDGRVFNSTLVPTSSLAGTPTGTFNISNTIVSNGLICATGPKMVPYDREERTPTSSASVVVSPTTPSRLNTYCGESSILAFNTGATSFTASAPSVALKANIAVTGVEVGYNAGWATLALGYPMIGGSYTRATNGAQGFGVYQDYRIR